MDPRLALIVAVSTLFRNFAVTPRRLLNVDFSNEKMAFHFAIFRLHRRVVREMFFRLGGAATVSNTMVRLSFPALNPMPTMRWG